MTTSPRRRRSAAVALTMTVLVFAAAGCAAAANPSAEDSAPSAPSAPSVGNLSADPVAGTGPTGWPGIDFPIPVGARSVTVELSCAGSGRYTVELGDAMALNQSVIAGECGAETPLAWPVTDQTDPTLAVTVDAGVAWTATPHFSAEEFPFDPAVTDDCAAFVDVYSALWNADSGYVNYAAIDEGEWADRVSTALPQLQALAAASTSPLAVPLASLASSVATATEPGTALRGSEEAVSQIAAACNANQTPYYITGGFGG